MNFPVLSFVGERISEGLASSSMIERTFSKVSRLVTKECNRRMSKSLQTMIQISQFDEFQRALLLVYLRHKLDYQMINVMDGEEDWVADSNSVEPDFLGGLIPSHSADEHISVD